MRALSAVQNLSLGDGDISPTTPIKRNEENKMTTENKNGLMELTVKEGYEITKTADENGVVKFKRKAVYQPFSSIVPETREQKIAMMNLLNGGDESQTAPLGDHLGKHIQIADVIFNPYDKINEDTGEQEFGVLSYLITHDGTVYVTSSKTVYFSLKRLFQVFGEPHYSEEEAITVKPIKRNGQQFKYTDIQIVG